MCTLLENDTVKALAKAAKTAAAELAAAKAAWEAETNIKIAQKLEEAEVAKRNAVRDIEEDAEVCSCAHLVYGEYLHVPDREMDRDLWF